jgi:hypothetical protein
MRLSLPFDSTKVQNNKESRTISKTFINIVEMQKARKPTVYELKIKPYSKDSNFVVYEHIFLRIKNLVAQEA